MSDGAPQATSMHSMPRRTLPRASSSVLPCSVVTVRASSSKCCSQSCLNLWSTCARALTGVSRQPGNASVAGGERRPADDVADGRIVHVEEIGGPGLHPAPADEVVECLNAGTIGYVG